MNAALAYILLLIVQWIINSGILWVVVNKMFRIEGTIVDCALCIFFLNIIGIIAGIIIGTIVFLLGFIGMLAGAIGSMIGTVIGVIIGLLLWVKWAGKVTANTLSCSYGQGITIFVVYWVINILTYLAAGLFMGGSLALMGLGSTLTSGDRYDANDYYVEEVPGLTFSEEEGEYLMGVGTTPAPTDSVTPAPSDAPTPAPTRTQTPEPTKTPLPPKKYASIQQAVKKGDAQDVITHLELGVEVDVKDRYGSTPLDSAVREGHKKVTEVLLERGARFDAKDRFGRTPLHWAAEKGHKEVAEALLAQGGADLDAKDNGGKTALDLARTKDHKDVVELLQTFGKND